MPVTRAAAARRCYNELPDDQLCAIFVAAGLESGCDKAAVGLGQGRQAGRQGPAPAGRRRLRPSASLSTDPAPRLRPSITRVCKRWHALFFTVPQQWREVAIVAPPAASGWDSKEAASAWAAAKQALLRRIAPLVQRVTVCRSPYEVDRDSTLSALHEGGVPLEALLAPLQPAELVLWCDAAAATPELLAGRTRLRSLLLQEHYSFRREASASVASLAPQLRSLELHACFVHDRDWRAALACTGLTRLALRPFVVLGSEYSWRDEGEGGGASPLLALTRLRALQELSIDHRPAMCAAGARAFSCARAGQLWLPLGTPAQPVTSPT